MSAPPVADEQEESGEVGDSEEVLLTSLPADVLQYVLLPFLPLASILRSVLPLTRFIRAVAISHLEAHSRRAKQRTQADDGISHEKTLLPSLLRDRRVREERLVLSFGPGGILCDRLIHEWQVFGSAESMWRLSRLCFAHLPDECIIRLLKRSERVTEEFYRTAPVPPREPDRRRIGEEWVPVPPDDVYVPEVVAKPAIAEYVRPALFALCLSRELFELASQLNRWELCHAHISGSFLRSFELSVSKLRSVGLTGADEDWKSSLWRRDLQTKVRHPGGAELGMMLATARWQEDRSDCAWYKESVLWRVLSHLCQYVRKHVSEIFRDRPEEDGPFPPCPDSDDYSFKTKEGFFPTQDKGVREEEEGAVVIPPPPPAAAAAVISPLLLSGGGFEDGLFGSFDDDDDEPEDDDASVMSPERAHEESQISKVENIENFDLRTHLVAYQKGLRDSCQDRNTGILSEDLLTVIFRDLNAAIIHMRSLLWVDRSLLSVAFAVGSERFFEEAICPRSGLQRRAMMREMQRGLIDNAVIFANGRFLRVLWKMLFPDKDDVDVGLEDGDVTRQRSRLAKHLLFIAFAKEKSGCCSFLLEEAFTGKASNESIGELLLVAVKAGWIGGVRMVWDKFFSKKKVAELPLDEVIWDARKGTKETVMFLLERLAFGERALRIAARDASGENRPLLLLAAEGAAAVAKGGRPFKKEKGSPSK